MIQYFTHRKINKRKWDTAISNSFNKLPFAYSWYLDIVSPGWDALVKGDYQEIMPLTHYKKLGINYLYQPLLCQQLGVFSMIKDEAFVVDEFIYSIPRKYKLVEICLNSQNIINDKKLIESTIQKNNQKLVLNKPYDHLFLNYHKSHVNNISKFSKNKTSFDILQKPYTDFYWYKMLSLRGNGIRLTNKNKQIYADLLMHLEAKNCLKTLIAYDNENSIAGGICFIKIEDRVMLQTFSFDRGKSTGLIYYLIDAFIKENSNQKLLFDFMGSSIDGIKFRNSGFGSDEEYYTFLRINRLNRISNVIRRVYRILYSKF